MVEKLAVVRFICMCVKPHGIVCSCSLWQMIFNQKCTCESPLFEVHSLMLECFPRLVVNVTLLLLLVLWPCCPFLFAPLLCSWPFGSFVIGLVLFKVRHVNLISYLRAAHLVCFPEVCVFSVSVCCFLVGLLLDICGLLLFGWTNAWRLWSVCLPRSMPGLSLTREEAAASAKQIKRPRGKPFLRLLARSCPQLPSKFRPRAAFAGFSRRFGRRLPSRRFFPQLFLRPSLFAAGSAASVTAACRGMPPRQSLHTLTAAAVTSQRFKRSRNFQGEGLGFRSRGLASSQRETPFKESRGSPGLRPRPRPGRSPRPSGWPRPRPRPWPSGWRGPRPRPRRRQSRGGWGGKDR